MIFPHRRRGVLMIDVLIGTAVFAIVVSGVIYAMLLGREGTLQSGNRIRATLLNQKALAAVRAVRDGNYDVLANGTFGFGLNDVGSWELAGTGVTTSDGYTTSVTLAADGDNRFDVAATTTWNLDALGSGTATLVTAVSDWHRELTIGDWSSVSVDGSYVDAGTPLFNHAVATESHLFVTSETSDGGAGLYVFDITSPGSPTRVASAFALGAPGYDELIVGQRLFTVTGDGGQEIRIYDIGDPSTLAFDDLVASIDVPGSANARTILYYAGILFVAGIEASGSSEIWSYDVSDLGAITLLDELNDPNTSYADIRLYDGYAYLASSADTLELRVLEIYDPANMAFASGDGYNLPDTPDGTSVVVAGQTVLLGRNQGDVTEELHLFDIGGSPVPSSAPFNAEAGANVYALDAEPTASYAFVATDHNSQELIVLDLSVFAAGGNPIVDTYNSTTGIGRGVTYDILHDRVFLLTNSAVVVLQPS